ncbi:hypothetical protein GCK72_021494 [Caenorhabditis remanei]|uniref:F-box domain-containing protein n=1 Tax=Caenorhabditis remanei TaxID=31234 RepID=A0A6A5GKR4_CAERE|nr:hypothetical protein GCK72_021494 [Caenorhabditis remanei]KAF1754929.1 hypothetical protein GCK72_021494 [Caenorhabditis remanei]
MSANLLDVPDLAMTNILNYLDYPVIQNVRKSCKALRRFIDTARIGALPDYIMLTDLHETVYLQAVFKSDTSLRISVFYKKEGDGCRIKYINEKDKEEKEEKVKVLENQDYLESFSTDCKLLLANEKIVLDELENMANENSMLKIIEDILKTRNQMIQIKKIYITVADDTEVANLVQYTNPNRLERLQIQINDNISELPEIEKLPHWRHVEEFQIFSVLSEVHPQKFSHFTKCHLRYILPDYKLQNGVPPEHRY